MQHFALAFVSKRLMDCFQSEIIQVWEKTGSQIFCLCKCKAVETILCYLHALIFDNCQQNNAVKVLSVSAFYKISINRSLNNVFLWNHKTIFLMQRMCRQWEKHCCQYITKRIFYQNYFVLQPKNQIISLSKCFKLPFCVCSITIICCEIPLTWRYIDERWNKLYANKQADDSERLCGWAGASW